MAVTVHQVTNQHQLNVFLNMPETLYHDHPFWVAPPLNQMVEKLRQIAPNQIALYVAVKNNWTVGRTLVMCHQNHPEKDTALFGYFESINDLKVAKELLDAVENWARAKKMNYITGPVSYNTNDSIGLLVAGFDRPSPLGMPYNHAYYGQLLEQCLYKKYFDLLAYHWHRECVLPKKLKRIAERVRKNKNIVLRPLNLFFIQREATLLAEIHNQTMQNNWGAEHLSVADAAYYLHNYRSFADPDLLLAVEIDDQPAGICLTLPDARTGVCRVAVMGVVPRYRHKGIAALLMYETAQRLLYKGYREADISLVLENNTMMNRILRDTMKFEVSKRYRVYRKKV